MSDKPWYAELPPAQKDLLHQFLVEIEDHPQHSDLGSRRAYHLFAGRKHEPLLCCARFDHGLAFRLTGKELQVGAYDDTSPLLFSTFRILWTVGGVHTTALSPIASRGCDQYRFCEYSGGRVAESVYAFSFGFDSVGNMHTILKLDPREHKNRRKPATAVEIDPELGVSNHELSILFGP